LFACLALRCVGIAAALPTVSRIAVSEEERHHNPNEQPHEPQVQCSMESCCIRICEDGVQKEMLGFHLRTKTRTGSINFGIHTLGNAADAFVQLNDTVEFIGRVFLRLDIRPFGRRA
jgi:hypothetical protein